MISTSNKEVTVVKKVIINEYLENVRPYLQDMIDNIKISGEWKINLKMKKKNFAQQHIPLNIVRCTLRVITQRSWVGLT